MATRGGSTVLFHVKQVSLRGSFDPSPSAGAPADDDSRMHGVGDQHVSRETEGEGGEAFHVKHAGG
jgi:hypothetical protein